ncbi:MAG: formate dehydrogenase subunit gamma [Betaproteobacteria bacterium]|nr:formate dehydrogenase subunit gamma [Betaproteobacteria bacterium]
MGTTLTRAARSVTAVACLTWLCAAWAQSPAVNATEADQAKQQAAQQLAQPLNNRPVWNEVRSGEPQYTSQRGAETNVLIQPMGQTWRAARVPVATIGGFLFVLTLLALAVFYVLRGPIKTSGAPTGRMVERFTLVERSVHWGVAITFVALAVTGLVITFGKSVLLPIIGYTLFSWLATLSKTLHNFVGPVLVVLLPIMIVLFLRENLFRAHDFAWFKKAGGMFSGEHVPAGKANAGQKLLFWLMVVVIGITLCVTGLILDFPNFNQTRATMQLANVVHMVAGIAGTILVAGHIYLGTIGMKGALDAMRTGYVDETWAKEHHLYWYNEVKAGKAGGEGAPPLAAPQRAG